MGALVRLLTPEASPEPELAPPGSGLWQSKPTATTTTSSSAAIQTLQKRKRSWPFPTTRPVSPPASASPYSTTTTTTTTTTSVKALWEQNAGWRAAAMRGCQQTPFQDARYEDLQPIFEALIESGIDDVTSPEYTLAFYPRAHELALSAENALLHRGDEALAAELYLRACAVLRVGRYSPSLPAAAAAAAAPAATEESASTPPQPGPACPARARAWQLQKAYHTKAGRLFPASAPLDEVTIPHTHDAATSPDHHHHHHAGVRDRGTTRCAPARPQIPAAVRLPPATLRTGRPCPAVLVASADRTAHSALCADLVARGWGCVVVEAPGRGDCPVPAAAAAAAEEALWASVLGWMSAIRVFDMARVVFWSAVDDDGGDDDVPGRIVSQVTSAASAASEARVHGCVALVGDGLVLFEYGAPGLGAEAARPVATGTAAVYDWLEDLARLDMAV